MANETTPSVRDILSGKVRGKQIEEAVDGPAAEAAPEAPELTPEEKERQELEQFEKEEAERIRQIELQEQQQKEQQQQEQQPQEQEQQQEPQPMPQGKMTPEERKAAEKAAEELEKAKALLRNIGILPPNPPAK